MILCYKVCTERGLVAIPEAKEGKSYASVTDGLLSRLYAMKENDYVLMYNIGSKKLKEPPFLIEPHYGKTGPIHSDAKSGAASIPLRIPWT